MAGKSSAANPAPRAEALATDVISGMTSRSSLPLDKEVDKEVDKVERETREKNETREIF